MNKLFFFIILNIYFLYSQERNNLDYFTQENAKVTAQGFAFSAKASGTESFFYNPAGFARGVKRLDILALSVWAETSKMLIDIIIGFLTKDPNKDNNNTINIRKQMESNGVIPSEIGDFLPNDLNEQLTSLDNNLKKASKSELNNVLKDTINKANDLGIVSKKDYNSMINDINAGKDINITEIMFNTDLSDINNLTGLMQEVKDSSIKNIESIDESDLDFFNPSTLSDSLNNLIKNIRLKVGFSYNTSYTGKNFGIGLFVNGKVNTREIFSLKALGLYGTGAATIPFGYAFNIYDYLPGQHKDKFLAVGFLVKPSFLFAINENNIDLISGLLGGSGLNIDSLLNSSLFYGLAFNLDLGLLWDIGWGLTFGASIKNIIPYFNFMYRTNFSSFKINFKKSISYKDKVNNAYDGGIPNISAGLAYDPDLGSLEKIIDFSVQFDYSDIIRSFMVKKSIDYLDYLKFGAEVKIFNFIFLRGGYTNKMVAVGLGFDLFIAELNAAFLYSMPLKGINGNLLKGSDVMRLAVDFNFKFNFK